MSDEQEEGGLEKQEETPFLLLIFSKNTCPEKKSRKDMRGNKSGYHRNNNHTKYSNPRVAICHYFFLHRTIARTGGVAGMRHAPLPPLRPVIFFSDIFPAASWVPWHESLKTVLCRMKGEKGAGRKSIRSVIQCVPIKTI